MMTTLISSWNVRSAHFLILKLWAILRTQSIHLSMQFSRLLVFLVNLSKFHICLWIGLILTRVMIRSRYLMIHEILFFLLLVDCLLPLILTIASLIHVYFLWELRVQFLLARHLTKIVAAECMRPVNLSLWYLCEVHLALVVVFVIHFNSSD